MRDYGCKREAVYGARVCSRQASNGRRQEALERIHAKDGHCRLRTESPLDAGRSRSLVAETFSRLGPAKTNCEARGWDAAEEESGRYPCSQTLERAAYSGAGFGGPDTSTRLEHHTSLGEPLDMLFLSL